MSGVYSKGPTNYKITRPTITEKMYKADQIFSLTYNYNEHRYTFSTMKDRWEDPKEDIGLEQTIDILSNVLTTLKYKGRLSMFNKNLENQIKERLKDILLKD